MRVAAAAAASADGCAAGAALCVAAARGETCQRSLVRCGWCVLIALILVSFPAVVLTNYLALACAELRLEGLRLEHACETSMVIAVNVSIASASAFSVQIADLNATILTASDAPLVGIAIGGAFDVRNGRHVYPARVELSILDVDELLRTLRQMAASIDRLSPIDEAYTAATTILGNARAANETLVGAGVDVAGADAGRVPDEEGDSPGMLDDGPRGGDGNGTRADADTDTDGYWHIRLAMTLGSRVVFGMQLGGRVGLLMEVSESAALKMKRAIAKVQQLAGCASKGGLDFDLSQPLGFAEWPPQLVHMSIGEISKAGVHVAGTVRFELSGPLAIDLFPALSVQLCSAPDAFLRNAGKDGRVPTDVGNVDVGAGRIGLGRASETINHAVAASNLNWTAAQVRQYRTSHASYAEGCIATVATQPFALQRGEPFDLSFDLAVPFYGNSTARFYGPLYFAEEISRGGALVVRGSSDREIAELGGRVFNSTYVEMRGRATSGCFVQRVMQEVRVRAHLLRLLPDAAPYIKDALLGASCMAGVFLHYFAHDNSTALNDDRVLEDCFAFMESSMAFGLDPNRQKQPSPHPPRAPATPRQPNLRVPRPLSASFRPSVRDLSGRTLYRFAPVQSVESATDNVACRWLNEADTTNRYFRARPHVADALACESACIKLKDCWAISFSTVSGHCELWNRVPREVAPESGSACLALVPQGSAFAFVDTADGSRGDVPGADDGWLELFAGAANHSLLALDDGELADAPRPTGSTGPTPALSEEAEDWWESSAPSKAAATNRGGRGGRRAL